MGYIRVVTFQNRRWNWVNFLFLNFFFCSCLLFLECSVKFTKLGCYNDDQNSPRPLPIEILNDIGSQSPGFSGSYANWGEWDEYYKDFICRCAKETLHHGYKVFGVQNFGKYQIFKTVYKFFYIFRAVRVRLFKHCWNITIFATAWPNLNNLRSLFEVLVTNDK